MLAQRAILQGGSSNIILYGKAAQNSRIRTAHGGLSGRSVILLGLLRCAENDKSNG
jgi:hypothetical protein